MFNPYETYEDTDTNVVVEYTIPNTGEVKRAFFPNKEVALSFISDTVVVNAKIVSE